MINFRTDEVQRTKAKHRRDSLGALGLCLNGAHHGPATHGVLCRVCRASHRGVDVTDVEPEGFFTFSDRRLPARFWDKVIPEPNSGCWLWLGATTLQGYGRIGVGGRNSGAIMAHRLSYERLVAPVPEGFELDHLCRTGLCVNPRHLEAVTHRENMLRGDTFAARQVAITHCPAGHEYTPDNTRIYMNKRSCRVCARALNRRRYRRQHA